MMIDIHEAIGSRHSVREYTDEAIADDLRARLEEEIALCNAEGGLSIKLICDESEAFDSTLAHYGKFRNVRNYIVLAGSPSESLDERCGYYGERLVLLAQQLGLNTCWVALTFKKRFVRKMLDPGEKLAVVIAIGHGVSEGVSHKTKSLDEVTSCSDGERLPEWFENGAKAALLAPTAMNQQKFLIELTKKESSEAKPVVNIRSLGGAYSDVDLGIVRLHFEIGAGLDRFSWEEEMKPGK